MAKVLWVFFFQVMSILCFTLSIFQVGSVGNSQSMLVILGSILIIPGVGAADCIRNLSGISFKVADIIFGITVSVNIIIAIAAIAIGIAGGDKYSHSMEQTYQIPLSTRGWNE